MRLYIFLLLIIYSICSLKSEFETYKTWKQEYGIFYNSAIEDGYRFIIFRNTLSEIENHNNNPANTWKKGITKFSALTQHEFSEIYLGRLMVKNKEQKLSKVQSIQKSLDPVDWVQAGAVNVVKDQGMCGASYAYAGVAAIEGLYKINKNQLPQLSWQQILDCSSSYGNYGCSGGYMTNVFDFAIAQGLTTEHAYPYTASNGTVGKCKISTGTYKVSKYIEVVKGDCDSMSNLLRQGPVAIAIDAFGLSNYHSGIVTNCTQNPSSGALLVGQNQTAWKVQMNFGTKWGINGYIYLAPGNTCAICDISSLPLI